MVRATVAAARALRGARRREGPRPDLADLARALHAEHTLQHTLERVVDLAPQAVPGCEHASVTLPGPATPAASDRLARHLDSFQYALGEGPCLAALASITPVLSPDLGAEDRWPEFAAVAVRSGVASALSCRLTLGGEALGSVNLYAAAAGTFGPNAVPLATAYAAHAAVALARGRRARAGDPAAPGGRVEPDGRHRDRPAHGHPADLRGRGVRPAAGGQPAHRPDAARHRRRRRPARRRADVTELWHIAERADWTAAREAGAYERSTRGLGLAEVGFVHCSYPDQAAGVAAAFYADVDDLVLLRIDPALVPAEIRVEGGFPHVYGPIPVTAVTAIEPLTRDATGRLVLPEG